MPVREIVAQVHRREELKTVFRAVSALDRASQHRVRMLATHAGLRLEVVPALREDGVNRVDALLEIEGVIDIVSPIEDLFLRIPPFHLVIAVFQIRVILIAGLQLAALTERQGIVEVGPQGFPVFRRFPGVPIRRRGVPVAVRPGATSGR